MTTDIIVQMPQSTSCELVWMALFRNWLNSNCTGRTELFTTMSSPELPNPEFVKVRCELESDATFIALKWT